MTVRAACKADLSQIVYLEAEMFSAPLTRREAVGMHSHAQALVFVDEWHKEIRGWLFCLQDTCSAEILRIGVAPAWERRGIGRDLIHHAATLIGDNLSLEMRTANIQLAAFLVKLDFDVVAECNGTKLYRRGWRFSRPPQLKYRMKENHG